MGPFTTTLLAYVGAAVLFAAAADLAPIEISASILEGFDPVTREQVVESLEELRRQPDDAERAGRIGMLLHANGHFTPAVEFYRRAVKYDPSNFRWLYYLATALESDRRTDEAEALYRKAREDSRGYIPLLLKLADLDLDQGRWEKSAEGYRLVLEQFPNLALAHYGLGRSLAGMGKLQEALHHLQRACTLSTTYGAAHYALARVLVSLDRREEAQRHLDLYTEYRLNRPIIVDGLLEEVERLRQGKQRALDLLAQGVAAGERGDVEGSIEFHRQAVELDPGMLQAHIHLLKLYGSTGQVQAAEEIYRTASPRFPHSADLHYNFGVVRLNQNEPDEARKLFEAALQINPLHPSANNNLGLMRELEGKLAEAESCYRDALKGDSSYRLARFNLARMLLARKEVDSAIAELERIVTPDDEETPRYLFGLAAAWARKGDQQKVLEYSRQALEKARKHGQIQLATAVEKELQRLQ